MSGLEITVRLTGDESLIRKLAARIVDGPKRRLLDRDGDVLLAHARANASKNVDTGVGLASIRKDVHGDTVTVGTDEPHMFYLHEGTRPHWPPIAAVAPWAARHGIDPFLVAKGISEHGTKANPFLKDAVEQSRGQLDGNVYRAAAEIERAMS